jgi:hypothetical protein
MNSKMRLEAPEIGPIFLDWTNLFGGSEFGEVPNRREKLPYWLC